MPAELREQHALVQEVGINDEGQQHHHFLEKKDQYAQALLCLGEMDAVRFGRKIHLLLPSPFILDNLRGPFFFFLTNKFCAIFSM